MNDFDLIIIGGGAGGFAAAIRANDLGARTAMINSGLPLGGTCVNVGCVPSKALLYAGEVLHLARNHGISGIDSEARQFDFAKVVQDGLGLVERLRKEKYEQVLGALESVTLFEGRARFAAGNTVLVNEDKLTAEKIIIATGSTASVPPIEGINETGYITHIEALKLARLPEKLIIVGAGPLGLEFAQMFARFGAKVTVLERISSIFPQTEPALAIRLAEILRAEGISIKTGAEVLSATMAGDKKVIAYREEGKHQEVYADEILLAAGKIANTEDLDPDMAEVERDRGKSIVVNEYFQTSNPHIFAVGDVTNLPLRLEITAGREGTLACGNALASSRDTLDYSTVPYTIFTDPQLAGVGFTEEEQMRRLGACSCRTVAFTHVPKALVLRRTEGLIKMAVAPDSGQIMGVHILSPHAGELIAQAATLVKNKNTLDDVVASTPMFPTLSEAIKIVALSFTRDISTLSCCI